MNKTKHFKYPNIEDCVGNTPLVKLQRLNSNPNNIVLLKLEGNNPASSVKDRPALSMFLDAEKKGLIKPKDTLIEATSGNTGIALASIAAMKGYKMILIMPEDASEERIKTMKAYGAQLILTSAKGSMEEARDKANQMVAQGLGYQLDQFANPANPQMHYQTTAKEIWQQTKKQITHFVASMGTTGTIMGCSSFFKQKNNNIQIIGVQPKDGAKIPGIRKWPKSHLPKIFDAKKIDQIYEVNENEAITTMKKLAQIEGIFSGPSSGGSLYTALEISKKVNNATIVSIVCDRGDRYISTDVYD